MWANIASVWADLRSLLIFCQLPGKMPHLSAGEVVCVHVYYVCVYVLTLCCQDVSSFVSYLPRYPIFRQAELHVCVHVYYNVCSCAYALTLLSRYFVSYLPSCPIFWQAELYVCLHVYCLYMLMISLLL